MQNNTKVKYGIWLFGAIALSLTLLATITFIYLYQRRILNENQLAMKIFKEARVDLSKGFLHVGLSSADYGDIPFQKETGLAYIDQATNHFTNSISILERKDNVVENDKLAAEFLRDIQVFKNDLKKWLTSDSRDAKSETELRKGFYSLEYKAAKVDVLLSKHFNEKRQKFEKVFYFSILGIAILLTILVIIVFKLIENEYKTNKALNDVEKNYQDLLENMLNGVIYLKSESNEIDDYAIVSCNAAFERMTNLKKLAGKRLSEIIDFKNKNNLDLIDLINESVTNKSMIARDLYLADFNLWVSTQAYSPQIGHVIFVFENISERMKYEMNLMEKNKEYLSLNEEYMVLNEELKKKIENISDINEQLEQSKIKAEESDRLKTAFLQNMSHEIRTPLNAILGFSDLLHDYFDDKARLKSFTEIIGQRGKDLMHIIDDILDVALIESGQISVIKEEFGLVKMLNDVEITIEEFIGRTKKSHVNFIKNYDLNSLDFNISTDQYRLKQILLNLLNNAFKFTHEGEIELSCSFQSDYMLKFVVKDTGIGIPSQTQGVIFDRFMQAENNSKVLYGGTGLGLSIVKGLIELLEGEIILESVEGKGTIFTIKIPVIPKNIHQPQVKYLDNHEFKKSFRILIVEDDKYNALYLEELLKGKGVEPVIVNSGQDAIDYCESNDLDLVLMDIRLLDMTGIEAATKIKMGKPNLKIIAQTAFASDSDRNKIMNLGFDGYVSKPISREEIYNSINSQLNN